MPETREKRPKTGGRSKGVRNKATAEIKVLAARFTEEALRCLADIMLDAGDDECDPPRPGAPAAARVAAAKELLDRAHGKAPQAHTGEGGTGPIRQVHEIIRRVVDPARD